MGTTVATNALLERNGKATCLAVTKGNILVRSLSNNRSF